MWIPLVLASAAGLGLYDIAKKHSVRDNAVMPVLGLATAIGSRLTRTPFQWRWSIPAVGLLLVGADWLYFKALSEPGVPISIVSLIRRSNVVLAFAVGSVLFKDENIRSKSVALLAILAGVAILCLASQ